MLFIDSVDNITQLSFSSQNLWLRRPQHVHTLCVIVRVHYQQSWWVHLTLPAVQCIIT